MTSHQVILILLCGEIWKSLCTAIPQMAPVKERSACTSIRSPTEDKALLYQLQATGASAHKSRRALSAAPGPQFPEANTEPSDGSWIAALIIGIILISMIAAIIVIVLWKCCRRPVLVDSNWAGPSPFADGDTPDVFVDSDQGTKRSSVLFMLPWKLKQDTNLQHDPTALDKPSHCTTSNENSQLPSTSQAHITASASLPNAEEPPAPTAEAASCAPNSCPHPEPSPESLHLPPPPDWLKEPVEDHSSDLSKDQELHSETEEQLPPPPDVLVQEIPQPVPQLPQPQHPS